MKSHNPDNCAADVGRNGPLILSFREPVDQQSAAAHLKLSKRDGTTVEAEIKWEKAGLRVALTPTRGLDALKTYIVKLIARSHTPRGI